MTGCLPPHCPGCSRFLILLFTAAGALAGTSTRTIDDQDGDSVTGLIPSYSGAWNLGPQCTGCRVQPDPSQAFSGTWHDATAHAGEEIRTMTAQFNGTAVYVYGILAPPIQYITTLTNVTFLLDGALVGSYSNDPTSTDYQYNVLMYSNENLPNEEHTIVLQDTGDTNPSLILFDHIVYTFTDQDPPSPAPLPPTTSPTQQPTSPRATSSSPSTPSSSSSTQSLSSSLSYIPSSNPPTSSHDSSTSLPSSGSQSPTSSGDNVTSTFTSSPNAGEQRTTTNASPTASPHRSGAAVGSIAGGVAGGVAVLIIVVALLCCMRRRRRRAVVGPSQEKRVVDDPLPTTIHPFGASMHSTSTMQSPLLNGQHATNVSLTSALSVSEPSSVVSRWQMSRQENHKGVDSGGGEAPDSRPLPDAPVSPSIAPLSLQLEHSQSNLAFSIPVMHFDSSSRTPTEQDSDHKSDIEFSAPSRLAAAPPWASQELPAPQTLPSPPIRSPTSISGVSTLRNQVVLLQEEITRLREEQELQRLLAEAPPEYVP
ncbi:hypothetical protein BD311DRAFT_416267 [Dichomitus squalens]|uniref:Uncharacterized protein n=1 Tax=Dichomitus squalens TaxID=114155 RepID=A0A4Q9MIU7_9APHY|nr:hypothetical protein BD311DRAFT_416267 [Dichomitus squalens]